MNDDLLSKPTVLQPILPEGKSNKKIEMYLYHVLTLLLLTFQTIG